MSDQNNGSPAFPTNTTNERNSGACYADGDMTLRDYAAIHADVPWAVVADQLYHMLGRNPSFDEVAEGAAVVRYKMADSMLLERAK